MQKYSDLDLIGFDINDMGIVEVRISKSRWDGEELLTREYHRANITPDVNADEYMGLVNADLLAQGFPALSVGDINQIIDAVNARRTPERVERYNLMVAEQRAKHSLPTNPEETP